MIDSTTQVLQAVTLTLVAAVGSILNILVLLVFYRRPVLRSPSNRFVLSLVLANFVSLLGLVPITLLQLIQKDLFSWLPHAVLGFMTLTVTTSVFSILAIAIDRYNAVLSPLHYTMTITRQRSRIMIVAVWCVSVLLSIPSVLGAINKRPQCVLTPENEVLRLSYTLVLVTLCFTLPVFALIWVYAKMYRAAHRNSERTRRHSVSTNPGDISRGGSLETNYPPVIPTTDYFRRTSKPPTLSQIHKRRCSNASISALLFREEGRAVKTAVIVIASFVFCWAPYFFSLLSDALSVEEIVPEACRFFATLSAVLNTVLSPCIYVYRNEIARSEAITMICFWKKKGLYKGNVLEQASKECETKNNDGIRIRHQSSSNYDSVSVQSFQLPTNYSIDCKQCAEILPHPPIADFVATYEIVHSPEDKATNSVEKVNESQPKTRGESVTFRLAFLPQKRCQTCIRQNSDSSSGSGYPLLRESEPPTPNLSYSGRRQEIISRASSGEESPTFRNKCCDSPKLIPIRSDEIKRDDTILEMEEQGTQKPNIFQFQETSLEGVREGEWVETSDVTKQKHHDSNRQDSDVTIDSGVDVGIDRSHSSSSSLSAVSPGPVVTRPKRHRHKLQRLAAVEDEENTEITKDIYKGKTLVKIPPCDFG